MRNSYFIYAKTLAKILALLLAGFLALGLLIGFFYGDEIKRRIISELNKQLLTEIQVENFAFSVFRHFPYASVDLQKVMVKGVLEDMPNDTLLFAQHLSLLFNMSGIFSKDLSVEKIVATDGMINIRINEKGKNNYRFWKSSADTIQSASVINLKQILLSNIGIRYHDIKNNQHYLMKADKAELKGSFSDDQYSLTADADLFMEHFYAGKTNYIINKPVRIRSGLNVNTPDGSYKFEKSSIKIADLEFDVSGFVIDLKDATVLNLKIESYEASLESFISMLPSQYVEYFRDYAIKGNFVSSIVIDGKSDANTNPTVVAGFSVRKGKLTPKESSVSLSDVDLNGTFSSKGLSGKSELDIASLSAILGEHKIKADFRLIDMDDPYLTMNASAKLDLAKVRHFISMDTLISLNGDLSFNIAFAGKVKDVNKYTTGQTYKVQSSGVIELDKVSFILKHNPLEYKNFRGKLSLQDNDLSVESLSGIISSSDLQLSGRLKNFINFIFIPGQSAEFNAKLTCRNLNLDELLIDKSSSSHDDTSYIMKFNPRLYSSLDVNVGNLAFRRIQAKRLQGSIHLQNQVISGRGLTFSAMQGMIFMDATINASRKDSILMNFDARISGLDVTELFWQLENFGQHTMTDKNVRGKINAEVQMHSSWTTSLVINPAKVRAVCDISIENGELINFRPVLAMANYIKVPDLNNIRFSVLKNQISIADRKILIPTMEIKSSALNLSASGIHDFDNMVDYRLRLLLSDVLGKKVKQNSEFGEIEDDGLGRTQLLLTMKGPVDDPKFGYDRKGAAEKLKTDIVKEKQTMKGILKEEFGLFKKDTIAVKKEPKKDEMRIDWDSGDE